MINLNLPEEVEQQLRSEYPDLDRRILENYAVEGFRQGELSSYQVRLILGLEDREQAIQFLSERGVYPNYGSKQLEEDRATLARLFNEKNQ